MTTTEFRYEAPSAAPAPPPPVGAVPIVCAQYDIVAPYVIPGDDNDHRAGAYAFAPLGYSVPPGGDPITDYFFPQGLTIVTVKPGFYSAGYQIEFSGLTAGTLVVSAFYLLAAPPMLPFGVGSTADLGPNDGPLIGLTLPLWPIRNVFGAGGIDMPEFRSSLQPITVQHVYTTVAFVAPWDAQGIPV